MCCPSLIWAQHDTLWSVCTVILATRCLQGWQCWSESSSRCSEVKHLNNWWVGYHKTSVRGWLTKWLLMMLWLFPRLKFFLTRFLNSCWKASKIFISHLWSHVGWALMTSMSLSVLTQHHQQTIISREKLNLLKGKYHHLRPNTWGNFVHIAHGNRTRC